MPISVPILIPSPMPTENQRESDSVTEFYAEEEASTSCLYQQRTQTSNPQQLPQGSRRELKQKLQPKNYHRGYKKYATDKGMQLKYQQNQPKVASRRKCKVSKQHQVFIRS
ncbi:OLC1v1012369C1 [Oldenlandia corymbosa var. corymbosa]|uniref:OLC1v1012369C1 n=1 Tax=Oldenlandia corymbosa var. corymbosa TaxID=529605 RepID=A0AAV1DXY3_OLDCO|nr:OLC1v1012369C1 [Oldenlandia corymbosa var. corymbosa]